MSCQWGLNWIHSTADRRDTKESSSRDDRGEVFFFFFFFSDDDITSYAINAQTAATRTASDRTVTAMTEVSDDALFLTSSHAPVNRPPRQGPRPISSVRSSLTLLVQWSTDDAHIAAEAAAGRHVASHPAAVNPAARSRNRLYRLHPSRQPRL